MRAAQAYRQNQKADLPRVDLILAVYDAVIDRLEKARSLLGTDAQKARALVVQCEVAIGGIAGGMPLAPASVDGAGKTGEDAVAANFLRLYEYVLHCLGETTEAGIRDALMTLQTLREGFLQVRAQ